MLRWVRSVARHLSVSRLEFECHKMAGSTHHFEGEGAMFVSVKGAHGRSSSLEQMPSRSLYPPEPPTVIISLEYDDMQAFEHQSSPVG